LVVQIVRQRKAALQPRPGVGERRSVGRRNVSVIFAGLKNGGLGAEAGSLVETKALLDSYLRLPEPEISGATQRGNANLRQGIRFARRNQRLILTEHDAGCRPVHLQGRRAQPNNAVIGLARSAEEIHVEEAVNFSSPEGLR